MPKAIKKIIEKKTDDEQYQESVDQLRERIQDRQRSLVKIGAAVVAVLIAAAGVFFYISASKAKAASYELEGYKMLAGVTSPGIQPAERYKKALESFSKAYAEQKRPDIRFYMGICQYEAGNTDEAIKAFQEVSDSPDLSFAGLGMYKLAMVYLNKGENEKALAVLNKLSLTKNAPFQDLAYLESGKILALQGKSDEAKTKYQALLTQFPKSPVAAEAKSLIGG